MIHEENTDPVKPGIGKQTPPAPDLLDVFSRHVSIAPGKSAVEFGGAVLTYAELDRMTNRLARLFQAHGVDTGSRVAVAMPRGLGEFTAILAVLKAGGAYVPVDPSHPVERVRLILEDAEPQILVAPGNSPLRDSLAKSASFVELDNPLINDSTSDDGPVEKQYSPLQAAYILFTSGSTGRPKGVAIPRGAIANFIHSASIEPGLSAADRLAAISTTTFDMSELDFFLPFYVGATVVIADRPTALDPALLRVFLEKNRITVMQATPTTWRMLLDTGWTGNPNFRIFSGGEAISLPLAERLVDCGSELWNLYGPTETAVYSTIERLRKGMERITVGRPIENTQITIRDPEGRRLPPDTPGEICIGGRGLAIGYYGRPDLTAERFPTDPATGERYYRTGDLGRYLSEDKLECLSRMDYQIKIRGFRIEPTDIEAQLRSVPGVSEILVTGVRQSEEGDPQLVAYWVGTATREDLYQSAKSRLPKYMVPSAYVHMDVFPLTTSGKVDRKKLPAPEATQATVDEGLAPRNDKESVIASIWREVLELSFVPVDVDFFSLGGTSIRALQVQRRIIDSFHLDLPLNALYEHPTVEGLVSQLGNPEEPDAPIVSILAKGANPVPWFGLMGIQLFEDIARPMAGSYSMLGIHVPARYRPGVDAFPTVQELAQKYIRAIRRHQPHGPYYLVGLCHGGIVAFEAAAQLEEAGETIGIVALLDAELPHARITIPAIRLRHVLRDAVRNPGVTIGKVLKKAANWHRPPKRAIQPGSPSGQLAPIDIPQDGPEIDADLLEYERLNRTVDCKVIAFRATDSGIAPWLQVAKDLGWSGRAKNLQCFDIHSSHLGIVRSPHATEIARLLSDARGQVEAQHS